MKEDSDGPACINKGSDYTIILVDNYRFKTRHMNGAETHVIFEGLDGDNSRLFVRFVSYTGGAIGSFCDDFVRNIFPNIQTIMKINKENLDV